MNKFMNINPGRFAAILGVFALALALSACGGGGGDGGTTVPTPSNPATGTLTASGCTVPDGASSCNAQASWTTSNATSPRLTSGGATVSTLPSGSATFSISLGTTSVTITNAGAVLASMNVTAGCAANSTVVSGICQATATPWWPPTTITPMGVKVAGSDAVRLPANCTSWTQQCWKDLVKSGAIKWLSTPATMVGYNSRPVLIAFYVDNQTGYNGQNGLYHTWLAYADTGEKVGGNDIVDGGSASDIDWIVGNSIGFLFHDKRDNKCWQFKWNPPTTDPTLSSSVWDYVTVPCP